MEVCVRGLKFVKQELEAVVALEEYFASGRNYNS